MGQYWYFLHPLFICHVIECVLASICIIMFLSDPGLYEIRFIWNQVDFPLSQPSKLNYSSFGSYLRTPHVFWRQMTGVETPKIKDFRDIQIVQENNEKRSTIYPSNDAPSTYHTVNKTIEVKYDQKQLINNGRHDIKRRHDTVDLFEDDELLRVKSTTFSPKLAGGHGSCKIDLIHCTFLGFFIICVVLVLSYILRTPIKDLTFIYIAVPCGAVYIASGGILLERYNMFYKAQKHTNVMTRTKVLLVALCSLACGTVFLVNFILHVLLYTNIWKAAPLQGHTDKNRSKKGKK